MNGLIKINIAIPDINISLRKTIMYFLLRNKKADKMNIHKMVVSDLVLDPSGVKFTQRIKNINIA